MLQLERTPKEARWQALRHEFSCTTDALGLPIDECILEVVVALNACGLPTAASCAGHLDHGEGAPWIMIEPPAVAGLRAQITILQALHTPGQWSPVVEEMVHLAATARTLQQEPRRTLAGHVRQFYQQRVTDQDSRLRLMHREWLGRTELSPSGINRQRRRAPAERAAKLAVYQEEMQAFGAFLKTAYFRQK